MIFEPRSQGQKSIALITWPRAYSRNANLSKYRGNRWSSLRTRWKGGVCSLYSKPWLSTKRNNQFENVHFISYKHLLLICVNFWDEAFLLLCSDPFRQCIMEMFLWIYSLLKSIILKTWKSSSSFIWGTFLFCLACIGIKREESPKMVMNLRNVFVWVYCILVGFLPWEAPTDFIISLDTFNQ